MAFTVTIHHGPYLLVVASGEALLCDVLGLVDLVARIANERGYARIMLDLIAVEPKLSSDEQVALGRHAAAVLCSLERVSVAVEKRFFTGVGGNTARADGLSIETFTELSRATSWVTA